MERSVHVDADLGAWQKAKLLKKIDMYGLKHAVIIIFILFLGVEEGGVNILHFILLL